MSSFKILSCDHCKKGRNHITGAFSSATTGTISWLICRIKDTEKWLCWHLSEVLIRFLSYIFGDPFLCKRTFTLHKTLGSPSSTMQWSQLPDKEQSPEGEGCTGISLQLGLQFATLSIISCYSDSVRNWLTKVCFPFEMVYLEITKEWMRWTLATNIGTIPHLSSSPGRKSWRSRQRWLVLYVS